MLIQMELLKTKYFKNNDRLSVLLLVFIFTIPFKPIIIVPIAFSLLCIAYIITGNKKAVLHNLKQRKVLFVFIIYYLFQVLGVIIHTKAGLNFSSIGTHFFLLAVPVLFLFFDFNSNHFLLIKKTYLVSCILFCCIAMLMLGYNYIVNYEHRFNYNFIQRSMFHYHYPYDVLYVNLAYIILLFNSFFNKLKFWITLLFFTFIVLSGLRIGLFVFIVIAVLFLILNFKEFLNIKYLLALLGLMILGFFLIKNSKYVNDKFFDSLSKMGFKTKEYVSDIGEDYHKITLRQTLWSSAMKAYNECENKLVGYGPKGSKKILNIIYERKQSKYDLRAMNSHNQYLTTLLDNGIIGLLILLTIFYLGFYFSYKLKSFQYALITLTIFISFFTESALERQKGVVIFVVFFLIIFLEHSLKLKNEAVVTSKNN